MNFSRRQLICVLSAALPYLAIGRPAAAAIVVNVSLWDKGEASMDGADPAMALGMSTMGAMKDMATMGITTDVVEIPAGEITFRVTNESKDFYHGLVISAVEDPAKELPYLTETAMVDEAAAGIAGRTKELKPHDSGTLKASLLPGTYVLYCNVSGHYMMGMWTLISVTG